MKNFRSKYLRILAVGIAVLFSCSDDDNNTTEPPEPPLDGNLRIYLSFAEEQSMPSHATMGNVKKLDLFVFDDEGKFLGMWTDRNPEITRDYYLSIPLDPGIYRFVAWGNIAERYITNPLVFIPGTTLFENVQLNMVKGDNDIIRSQLPSLFFGEVKRAVVRGGENEHFFMPVVCNSYKINMNTDNLKPDAGTYYMAVSDNNGNYYFDNTLAECNTFHYLTECLKDNEGQLKASLTVNKLEESRNVPILGIYKGTDMVPVFRCNLIEAILNLRNNGMWFDFKTMHEFNIVLRFNDDMSVDMSVNGWRPNNQDGFI